jgi:hypothetical protein
MRSLAPVDEQCCQPPHWHRELRQERTTRAVCAPSAVVLPPAPCRIARSAALRSVRQAVIARQSRPRRPSPGIFPSRTALRRQGRVSEAPLVAAFLPEQVPAQTTAARRRSGCASKRLQCVRSWNAASAGVQYKCSVSAWPEHHKTSRCRQPLQHSSCVRKTHTSRFVQRGSGRPSWLVVLAPPVSCPHIRLGRRGG